LNVGKTGQELVRNSPGSFSAFRAFRVWLVALEAESSANLFIEAAANLVQGGPHVVPDIVGGKIGFPEISGKKNGANLLDGVHNHVNGGKLPVVSIQCAKYLDIVMRITEILNDGRQIRCFQTRFIADHSLTLPVDYEP
jgi:hypothetical protein